MATIYCAYRANDVDILCARFTTGVKRDRDGEPTAGDKSAAAMHITPSGPALNRRIMCAGRALERSIGLSYKTALCATDEPATA